ncbi:uncharacterized protein LOC133642986 [Entelurus aequoreus]|uniref:uncharacterized protein LOC133642986 n=1 Tax=Entelurus aequoreus TaxID=161455 RepID=UPI002B1D2114|nr:uncharacterized protein LOC133642986 [Entelurus aequoreus]
MCKQLRTKFLGKPEVGTARSAYQEELECLSAVSSYCDVRAGWPGHEENSLCVLSPNCQLYLCDADCSTDSSCLEQSDDREPRGSGSAEDDYPPLRMTRLDPPPHRPTPRAWMEESRSIDGFSKRSGFKEDKEKRESGYFSLGRATSAHSLRDNSPHGPFRYFERGHPVFSSKNIEPKDTIPFRNPNLGVASERQVPEVLESDLPVEIPPLDPYGIAVEVEAQLGPRSPSPTPFKIAESLASTRPKGYTRSYDRGNPNYKSSHQQSGRFDSSRLSSALQSRSSSPARGNSLLRGGEFPSALRGHPLDGAEWSKGMGSRSRGSLQAAHGRGVESGTLPRNFQSFAGSVKSQSNTISDFRNALRKTEVSGSHSGHGPNSRSSSPVIMSLCPTENRSSSLHRLNNRTSSPSRRPSESRYDTRGSSPPRRASSSFCQSGLRKSDSMTSLDERSHHGRCGSPIREGYDIESQALLRNLTAGNARNSQEDKNTTTSPTRLGYDASSQPKLHKKEFSTTGRSQQSPERRSFKTPGQYSLRKNENSSASFNGPQSRNTSPSRRSYEAPTQSILRKSEPKARDSHISSSSKQRYSAPHQTLFYNSELSSSPKGKNHNSCNASLSQNATGESPGHSVLRNSTKGNASRSLHRRNDYSKSDPNHSPRSWRQSAHSLRSSSLSRAASPALQNATGNRTPSNTLQTQRSPGSVRARVRGQSLENQFPRDSPGSVRSQVKGQSLETQFPRDSPGSVRSQLRGQSLENQFPKDRGPCDRARSPSPTLQIKMQSHTYSQSSMDSSESGQLSVVATDRNKGEYARIADLPKVKIIQQQEDSSYMDIPQNHQRSRRQELFKPASHSLTNHPFRAWEDTGETDKERYYGGSGYLSRAHSSTSLQRSCSPTVDEGVFWNESHPKPAPMQVHYMGSLF